jgi:hypothetical protein
MIGVVSKGPATQRQLLRLADSGGSPVYVHRLGLHHFAYLRAIAEGLPIVEAAKRYLGVEHGHQAKVAHLQTRDAVRAVARRRGLSAWRLIGLSFSAMPLEAASYKGFHAGTAENSVSPDSARAGASPSVRASRGRRHQSACSRNHLCDRAHNKRWLGYLWEMSAIRRYDMQTLRR